MARTKGMLNLSGNLEVNAGAPLDARSVVPTLADLTVASNFQYKYIGMTVVVQATGDMYVLTANDVTVAANWKQVGSGGGGTSYTAGDGIVIEDDEISTDNMPAADMAEIVTPLPSVMSRLLRYTTEEQMIGYWIDNKPFYQKVIELTSPTSVNSTVSVDVTSLNIDKMIKLEGIIDSSTQFTNSDWAYSGTNCSCLFYVKNEKRIYHYLGNGASSYVNSAECIIIQYTKTTD